MLNHKTRFRNLSASLPYYSSLNHWKPHSATWENAQYFKKYWKKRVVARGKNIGNLSEAQKVTFAGRMRKRLSKGDVIQYGYGINNTVHSQICHGKGKDQNGKNTLFMAQHTDNDKNMSLHEYIKSTGCTYVTYYKMGELK